VRKNRLYCEKPDRKSLFPSDNERQGHRRAIEFVSAIEPARITRDEHNKAPAKPKRMARDLSDAVSNGLHRTMAYGALP
jgi:hypothetical protein